MHINLCRATPLNRSDPDLVQWSKAAGPVAATGGDGPSAAWSTGTGEHRMIVGAGRKPMVYLLRATYISLFSSELICRCIWIRLWNEMKLIARSRYSDSGTAMRWWRSVGLLPNAASGECPSFMCVIIQLLHLTILSSIRTRCSCAKSLLTFTASNMQGATSDHRGLWTSTTWDPDVTGRAIALPSVGTPQGRPTRPEDGK
jgi:hypothetical protein